MVDGLAGCCVGVSQRYRWDEWQGSDAVWAKRSV